MKFLIISPMLPNQKEQMGLSKIVLNTIEHLSRRNHEVSLVSFCVSEEERALAEELRKYCRSVDTALLKAGAVKIWMSRLLTIFTKTPFFISIYNSAEMHSTVSRAASRQHYDAVHIHGLNMAQYIDDLAPKPATMLIVHDVFITRLFREYKAARFFLKKLFKYRDWKNICRYEPDMSRRFDTAVVCSSQDGKVLQSHDPDIDVSVVPFAIDEHYFDIPLNDAVEKNIIFFGSFIHPPNADAALYFCEEIFPIIKKSVPDVKLYIIGGSPPEKIRKFGNDESISVTGYVPEIEEYLARASVSVAPLRFGAGMKMKILVSMASGRAVVTTPVGLESIDAVPGEDLMLADSSQDFADKTVQLLEAPDLRRRLGENGRRLVREKYTWKTNIEKIEKISEKYAANKN